MIDPNYIHQRDVSNILTQLQKDVARIKEKYSDNPDDPKLSEELQDLIDTADRDLRLKTQAIVRSRLSQSRILPINYKMSPMPAISSRPRSTASNQSPLPPLPDEHEDLRQSVRKRGVQSALEHQKPTPITPISRQKKASTNLTATTEKQRTVKIQQHREQLPKVDRRDPSAPPPPVTQNMVNTYGLQQLNESGLIRNADITRHLTGVVTVGPFIREPSTTQSESTTVFRLDPEACSKSNEVKVMVNSSASTPSSESERRRIEEEEEKKKKEKQEEAKRRTFWFINGEPDESALDYITFRKDYTTKLEIIDIYLRMLRNLCEGKGISRVKIDCQSLIDLTLIDPDECPVERLMKCLVGNFSNKKGSRKIGFGFIGKDAEKKAAIVIQSIYRGFLARRFLRFIRRNFHAASSIQKWYRNNRDTLQIRLSIRKQKSERISHFISIQQSFDKMAFQQYHFLLHIIDSHFPSELGRISSLHNKNAFLIIVSRMALPTVIADYLKANVDDQKRLFFVVPKQRLPYTLPMEDVLACDQRLLEHIRDISKGRPIFIVPNQIRASLIEVSIALNAVLLSPSPIDPDRFINFTIIKEFLSKCSDKSVQLSQEIQTKDKLCEILASMTTSNIQIENWLIRSKTNQTKKSLSLCNSNFIGDFCWVDTSDMPLLSKMKENANLLSPKDLNDKSFIELLAKNISNNFENFINTISTIDKKKFISDIWDNGAFIEETPQNPVSYTSISLFISPTGERKITGAWENLYISKFETFASIHPAFIVDSPTLKERVSKIADELVNNQTIGDIVIDFWGSIQKNEFILTPNNMKYAGIERCLPQMLSESICKSSFDEETMKMDKFTYVQDRLVLPQEIAFDDFISKCKSNGIKVNENVFFLPDLQEDITIGMVVTADTIAELINLVYNTFCILSEKVFDIQGDPTALLFNYCSAIEYLKDQIDSEHEIKNALFMKKVNVKVVEDKQKPKLYKFGPNNAKFEPVSVPDSVFESMDDSDVENVSMRRSLITTPTDSRGRERKLMTPSDDDDKESFKQEKMKKRKDLPEAPAGASLKD